ncbi:hypothetical protein B0H19DRAFT_1192807 [Mycena capillaripes]|nr:hypothetical protein B0H19DRAFT_1192807 [Mycena capillaripes]
MDNSLLVFPHRDIIQQMWLRDDRMKFGVRRPHIRKGYKGCASFEYLVVPVDPRSDLPVHIFVSEVPPHLMWCTTVGKVMKAWGRLKGNHYHAVRLSLIERAKTAADNGRPALDLSDFDTMRLINRTWTWVDHVPPSFLSEDSDQTVVEVAESSDSKSDSGFSSTLAWEVQSSASCYHEPKRRLLPCELQRELPTANIQLFPSADGEEDESDAISADSYISGVDDPDEFAKASAARGDYAMDRKSLKRIKRWAECASGADTEEILLNDAQIKEDPREQPRAATSLDLEKPDYISKTAGSSFASFPSWGKTGKT